MGVAMTTGNRRIDRVLDEAYLAGIDDATEERLREMRDECEEEEGLLSYERQLLHGRLDIIRAELQRRSSGGSSESLIERLPEILSGEGPRTHRGSFPKLLPPPMADPPRRRAEKLVSNDTLARLPDLSEPEIRDIAGDLESAEREVSESRRRVQAVLDRLSEELGRRLADA